jgi:CheY-like chemotaxis protein
VAQRSARHAGRAALIVDDSEDQAHLLSVHLERLGFSVSVVGSAEAAMESYRRVEPAVAVIDLLLPGMDGWELIDAMKADAPGARLIVTSVLGTEDYPAADAVLPKPFTFRQVADTMDTIFPTD